MRECETNSQVVLPEKMSTVWQDNRLTAMITKKINIIKAKMLIMWLPRVVDKFPFQVMDVLRYEIEMIVSNVIA